MSERDDYWGDVIYETRRRGGNPDLVNRNRVVDHQDAGLYPEESARREIRRQRRNTGGGGEGG